MLLGRTVPGMETTQTRRPWRATVRTLFQFALALATLLPYLVSGVWTNPETVPVMAGQVLGVAATVTRVMALPQVEVFLRQWFPWLAADTADGYEGKHSAN